MITPVLMCGGSGTRLWPLSRRSYPKQFVALIGEETLFQACAQRFTGSLFDPAVVVTGSDFRFIVSEQLTAAGLKADAILIEPAGRNTAPAILAATLQIAAKDPNALILIAPSDHVLPDHDAFQDAVQAGVEPARNGQIVTFGIAPDRPETGYGYLELSRKPKTVEPIELSRFVEKPDAKTAAEMCASGKYLWNAGIFLFTAKTMLEAFRSHAPGLIEPVETAMRKAHTDLTFLRLDPEPWAEADDISIDYAVMEHAENLVVVPFQGRWSDLGDWNAVWRQEAASDADVVTDGAATAIDCSGSLLRSESDAVEVVGIGLEDTIVVAMPDAVLVADKSRAQDVKHAVAKLKEKSAPQATMFPKDHRPWGWFESLVIGGRFQVKRIHVHPGGKLSLQSHNHRSEHWIVVEGTAKVTIDDEVKLVTENQSVYVPLGSVHRMENPGKVPMVLIEVQTGSYLGEDDIQRYDDAYGRDYDPGAE